MQEVYQIACSPLANRGARASGHDDGRDGCAEFRRAHGDWNERRPIMCRSFVLGTNISVLGLSAIKVGPKHHQTIDGRSEYLGGVSSQCNRDQPERRATITYRSTVSATAAVRPSGSTSMSSQAQARKRSTFGAATMFRSKVAKHSLVASASGVVTVDGVVQSWSNPAQIRRIPIRRRTRTGSTHTLPMRPSAAWATVCTQTT